MNTTYFIKMVSGNVFVNISSPALPSTFFVGASLTTPNIDGTGVTEPSGGAYARVALNRDITALNAPDANGMTSNKNDLLFNEATSAWGTLTNYVIYDSLTNGNLLMYGAFTEAKPMTKQDILLIKAGQLQLQPVNPS